MEGKIRGKPKPIKVDKLAVANLWRQFMEALLKLEGICHLLLSNL